MSASNAMLEFHDFINCSALVDLDLRGWELTWSRSGEATTCSRLDHSLISIDWKESWPTFIQKRLHRPLSNHYLICLKKSGA